MAIKTGRYKGQNIHYYGSVVMRFYEQDTATPSRRFYIGCKKFKAGETQSVKVKVDSEIHDIEQVEVGHEKYYGKHPVHYNLISCTC